mmetsp:Transcript_21757/g.66959  ORF Transcript_21757/g.66959 Transcript_21757/m.66959 type:complete len:158 (+) Transcript_21757:2113-2586(+)
MASSQRAAPVCASTAESTSSRIATFGRAKSARAKATRACWPPDSWTPDGPTAVASPNGHDDTSGPSLLLSTTSSRRATSSGKPKRMLSRTVPDARNGRCATYARRARRGQAGRPRAAGIAPAIVFKSVDLPEPTGPTMQTISPGAQRTDASTTTRSP